MTAIVSVTSTTAKELNNKSRAITTRSYAVRSSSTLWIRLILDQNQASEAMGQSTAELREIIGRPSGRVSRFCT